MPLFATVSAGSARGLGLGAANRLLRISGGTRTTGTINQVDYTFFTFTSPGSLVISGSSEVQAEIVAVRAGAGGGGSSAPPSDCCSAPNGAGGQGGAVVQTSRTLTKGTHSVIVGSSNAANSTISIPYGTPVVGTGGGGRGGVRTGQTAPWYNPTYNLCPGESGTTTSIYGTPVTYGGGGGSGRFATAVPNSGGGGAGGAGGGGNGGSSSGGLVGNPGSPGAANTGGGGGGAGRVSGATVGGNNSASGGAGGSGIVIVRIPSELVAPE